MGSRADTGKPCRKRHKRALEQYCAGVRGDGKKATWSLSAMHFDTPNMSPEKMLELARSMRGKVPPLEVYILQTPEGWWMVPVPNDDSSKWPRGIDPEGKEVKMAPVQPVKLEVA